MNETKNAYFVSSVRNIPPVKDIERNKWVANNVLKKLMIYFISALEQ